MQQNKYIVMSNSVDEGIRIQFELKAWNFKDALLKINLHPFTFPDDFLPEVSEQNPRIGLEPEWCSNVRKELEEYDNLLDYMNDDDFIPDEETQQHIREALQTAMKFYGEYGAVPTAEGNYLSENNTQWIIIEVAPYGNVTYHGLEEDKKCLK